MINYLIFKIENNKLKKISIIIPTLNESKSLPLLLSDLSEINDIAEIIIIDCGSSDKTLEIANLYGTKFYKLKEKNRGLQLNYGAQKAKGEWLFFLHADSRFKLDWSNEIESVIKGNKLLIYFFKFRINNRKFEYRLLELLVNLRSKVFKTPYGDQGLIINNKTFKNNNGFRELSLMEDIDFILRLKNKKYLKCLKASIYTSSRKWDKNNIFSQSIKNWKLRQKWLIGQPIDEIYNEYYK